MFSLSRLFDLIFMLLLVLKFHNFQTTDVLTEKMGCERDENVSKGLQELHRNISCLFASLQIISLVLKFLVPTIEVICKKSYFFRKCRK